MTMTKSDDDFDAVAMKRRAARKIHERLADKDQDERRDYWKERTEVLRQRQAERKASENSSSQ